MLAKVLPCVALLLAVPALAAAQASQPITETKVLAGTWNGWYNPLRGGPPARAQLMVKDDGSWTFYVTGANPTTGRITLADGQASYQGSVGDPGSVVLLESKGKSVLRFVRRDGTIASEFER